MIGLWAAIVVGAVQLYDGNIAHAAAALVRVRCGHRRRHVPRSVGRARWSRLRSWPRPGEAEEYPAGPRRVLLVDTGLAGPE